MRSEFITAIKANHNAFGIELSETGIERLADYYELVQEHNPLLHLVGPGSPEEFAIRHVLESLMLLDYLPKGAKFADVGTGAGLPSIPCLLVREDLRAILIESKEKKAGFLRSAVQALSLSGRAEVINRQFDEADPSDCEFVTCRALDKFTEKLLRLLRWSKQRRSLFFGGKNLSEALQKQSIKFDQHLMPMSEQRFLFILHR